MTSRLVFKLSFQTADDVKTPLAGKNKPKETNMKAERVVKEL